MPAVSTAGSGQFSAKIDENAGIIYWELTYDGMQGTVVQSHIHFGQHSVNGGVTAWLCQSATNPAPAAVARKAAAGRFTMSVDVRSPINPKTAGDLDRGDRLTRCDRPRAAPGPS